MKDTIYDPLRKKAVALTPEERVRHAFVQYLLEQCHYPMEYMANEYTIEVGRLTRRCDTVVFSRDLSPVMVIEYKAQQVALTQQVIDQAFRYNSVLQVPYIVITNGREIGIFRVGYGGEATLQLRQLPPYAELTATAPESGR